VALLSSALLAGQGGGQPPPGWSDAPAYLDLFTPAPHRDAYRAFVSPLPLDQLLPLLADDSSLLHPPGSWQSRTLRPVDAFGRSGAYNRWTLSRLYGSTQARMAVGPTVDADGRHETWMLISPYPNPTLTTLEPGTLLLIVQMPQP
jgi:hypothetical protein